MSDNVRMFRVRPRLALLMGERKDSIHVSQALQQAEKGLEKLRESCLEGLDRALDEMEGLVAQWPASAEAIYILSGKMIDVTGPAEAKGVEVAARSLCDILDQGGGSDAKRLEAVKVHVASLRLLHRSSAPPEMQAQILGGLAQVATSLGVTDEAASA